MKDLRESKSLINDAFVTGERIQFRLRKASKNLYKTVRFGL